MVGQNTILNRSLCWKSTSRTSSHMVVCQDKSRRSQITDLMVFSTFVGRYEKDGHDSAVFCLQFSPGGQHCATGAHDGIIKCILSNFVFPVISRMRINTQTIYDITFSPITNGRSLFSQSNDRSVRIWNLRDGSPKVLTVTGRINLVVCCIQPRWTVHCRKRFERF